MTAAQEAADLAGRERVLSFLCLIDQIDQAHRPPVGVPEADLAPPASASQAPAEPDPLTIDLGPVDGATARLLGDAILGSDVVRLDVTRSDLDAGLMRGLIERIEACGAGRPLWARIDAAAVASAAALLLAEAVEAIEIRLARDTSVAEAQLRSPGLAAYLDRLGSGARAVPSRAVFEVGRKSLGRLAPLVEAAQAAGFPEIGFEARFVTRVEEIDDSAYFDRAGYNDDIDRAIQAGKKAGLFVAAVKFGTQGPPASSGPPGRQRVLAVELVAEARRAFAWLVPFRHLDREGSHFHPHVIASPEFARRVAHEAADRSLAGYQAVFRRRGLDPGFYAEVVRRLEIDPREDAAGGGDAIRALNRAIERRFGEVADAGEDRVVIDFTKPFIGFNWGPAKTALLPDQHQFRRLFNETQAPTVLLRVAAAGDYRLRTIIHEADPGDSIDFLQLACNGFVPTDQRVQFEGPLCVHICTVPSAVVAVAEGRLRISYALTRKRPNGALARLGLRQLIAEPADREPSRRKQAVLRSPLRQPVPADADPAAGIGEPLEPIPAGSATIALAPAIAVARASGCVAPGKEAAVAAFVAQLADLEARGAVADAATQALAVARNLEAVEPAESWLRPPPVQHRYTGIELGYQLLTVLRLALGSPTATALFTAVVETDPTFRPGWLVLADCHIAAGAADAAIVAARSATRQDMCCLISQEVLRRAYLAKYPDPPQPVIDGVPLYDLTDRFCNVPFDRIESAKDGIIWACCPAWLGAPIGNMHRMRWEEAWNSDQAALVRQSILDGSFKYCNGGVCPAILADGLPKKSEVTDRHYRHYIDNNLVRLSEGPRDVHLSHDPSCNLACPQCRTGFLLANDDQNAEFVDAVDSFIKPLIEFAHLDRSNILMSGDGEIFVSRHYRHMLGLFDPEKHSGVNLNLLSNGLVFQTGWEKFPNIHPLVRSVTISTDGASEAVYREVRGGSWAKLFRNLEYIAALRQRGDIARFDINYAVQACNYKDMRRMVEIGLQLGIDRIAWKTAWNSDPAFGVISVQ